MRTPVRLTDVKCRTASTGSHCDGHGLYLLVKPAGTRSWLFRYSLLGQQHWMGLGSFPVVTLKRAREKALEARRLLADGEDPLTHKRAARASLRQQHTKQLRALTFDQCAEQFIKSHSAGWRSMMHGKQWSQSLRDHVSPAIGDMPVTAIDTESVLKVLEPIWTKMPTAAGRVRNRIELILDWARGAVRHFPSIPHGELPSFIARLRQSESVASRALEFTILTACRSSEVLGAKWSEIDLATRVWTIPAGRMKSSREHRVPLSLQAVDLLAAMRRNGESVFEIGSGTMLALLRRTRTGASVHGFRSSFRDWCAERTTYSREVCEAALAHRLGDATERAYFRSDLFEQRSALMAAWGNYCTSTGGEVVQLRRASN